VQVEIRPATLADEASLVAVDIAAWTPELWVSAKPSPGQRFFAKRHGREDTLVAEVDGEVRGYVVVSEATPLPGNAHVLMIRGLTVDPQAGRRGIGRRLMEAAIALAAGRGARRLTLRVLAPNAGARALYRSLGFVEEGVLRGEFHLAGRDVDDVLMALELRR
jgi:ribosomal protein S18 acetylase RimI-like enzyme